MDFVRGHSTLTIKEIEEVSSEERVLTGIASTPATDRMDDIVEPDGAEFTLPIPLLWQHRADQPIGEVFYARKTKEGIEIKARIAKIKEPGALKDRIDDAWHTIKYGLVRGLSIGFKSLEHTHIDGTFGIRFIKWLWLELSAVTIPANSEATIQAIKSIDARDRAALGEGSPASSPTKPAGAAAPTRKTSAMLQKKTYAEQISGFEATLLSKKNRMDEMMTKSADTGTTFDEAEETEYDGLEEEVKSLNAHITRLRNLEALNVSKAAPVKGATQEEASRSRAGLHVVRMTDNTPKGRDFIRLVMCKAASFIEFQKGNLKTAEQFAREWYPDSRAHMALKAVVPAATTSTEAWAGALVEFQTIANEFIELTRPETILGKFGQNGIPSLHSVPFNSRFATQTSEADAYWVGEGRPKPLTSFALDTLTLGPAKIATISVLTQETVRFSSPNAENLVDQALRRAIIRRMDIDFVDPAKALSANVSPASITNGLTPLSSAGTSVDNILTDILSLVSAFTDDNQGVEDLVLIMPSTLALAASLMRTSLGNPAFPNITSRGGTLQGIPVITSQYVANQSGAGNMVIAVNAQEIFLADDGQVEVEASREASLEMSNTPTQNGAAGTGASLVSLWQNNMIALKAERFINWSKRRAEAVVYMDDVNWGSVGSPS